LKSSIYILFGTITLALALSFGTCHGEDSGLEARVIKVHDGDTVSVSFGQKREKIRLIGIDAPELFQEPWGKIAKEHLRRLLGSPKRRGYPNPFGSSRVKIETDVEKRDRYGRLLAYVWTKDGKCVNVEMVRDGLAVLYTVPPNVKYADILRDAQREAKEAERGIWRRGLEESPQQYRKEHPRS
jgi:micrococcal nuclease